MEKPIWSVKPNRAFADEYELSPQEIIKQLKSSHLHRETEGRTGRELMPFHMHFAGNRRLEVVAQPYIPTQEEAVLLEYRKLVKVRCLGVNVPAMVARIEQGQGFGMTIAKAHHPVDREWLHFADRGLAETGPDHNVTEMMGAIAKMHDRGVFMQDLTPGTVNYEYDGEQVRPIFLGVNANTPVLDDGLRIKGRERKRPGRDNLTPNEIAILSGYERLAGMRVGRYVGMLVRFGEMIDDHDGLFGRAMQEYETSRKVPVTELIPAPEFRLTAWRAFTKALADYI
jgi:hypothetical protein